MSDDEDSDFEDCIQNNNENRSEDFMIKMVHVAFVLPSNTEPRSTVHYQKVSKMLGKALR